MQHLGRDVTIVTGEEQLGERHALARGPEARLPQDSGNVSQRWLGWQPRKDRRRPMHLNDHVRQTLEEI
jgi:hypothetical protein